MLSSPTTPPLIQLYSEKANVCEGPWFVKYYTINFSYIIQPFNHLKVRYYLHLTSEKSEAQKGEVTCQRFKLATSWSCDSNPSRAAPIAPRPSWWVHLGTDTPRTTPAAFLGPDSKNDGAPHVLCLNTTCKFHRFSRKKKNGCADLGIIIVSSTQPI